MIYKLFFLAILMASCTGYEDSQLQSYQTRDGNNYVYLLTHTTRLDGAENTEVMIPQGELENYGQCFYKVTSESKIRLHRPAELTSALQKAEPVNSSYLPLDQMWNLMQKDRALQELYTSERHWILPTIGAFAMTVPILAVDSVLHEANGEIVEKSQQVVDGFKVGDTSLRTKAYKALHLTAKVEHAADELMHQAITMGGSKNPLRAARKALLESKPSRSLAVFFKKHCLGKKAIICTVLYIATFNGMFAVGLPVGGNKIADSLARYFNKETEESTLHNLLGDKQPLGKTRSTSKKTLAALEKVANKKENTAQRTCPLPQELLAKEIVSTTIQPEVAENGR